MIYRVGIVLLIIYTLITLIFIGVDFYYWFIDRYSRYHIGRWENEKKWMRKFYNISISWLPVIPSIPITSNKHLVLLDMLKGTYKRKSVQSWQTAGLLLGVNSYQKKISKKTIEKTVNHFINKDGMWKVPPDHVSYAMLAYALLKSSKNKEFIKPSADYMLELILSRIRPDGMIAYSMNRIDNRYVDTLGLVSPFLALYSKTFGQKKYMDIAIEQIFKFNKYGLFTDEWLPVHAFEVKNKLPLGVYGWGRGTGWYTLALVDVYLEMEDHKDKETLKNTIKQVADYLCEFQRDDGGFGIFIQNKSSYDSSATAIIAYFYAVVYEIFRKERYYKILEKGIKKLKSMTRQSGKLDYCQGDTVDVGIFSQRSDIMPFAQGMTLRAYVIYKKYQSE